MNTTSVVNEVQRLNPDYTDAQILDIVNNVVKLLCKRERDTSIYIDPATGDLPFLTTTSGTYSYTPAITGVTFWKIRAIVASPDTGITFDYSKNNFDREYFQVKFRNRIYQRVPAQLKDESDTATTPQAVFLDDPGSYSDRYQIMAYESPTEILSLSVNIPIADKFRYSVVVPAIQSVIDGLDNGRYAEGMQYIESVLAPMLDPDFDTASTQSANYSY